MASLVVRSTVRDVSIVKRPVELQDTDVKEAEAMVVLQMAQKRQRTSVRRTMEEVIASIRLRSTIIADLIRQVQKGGHRIPIGSSAQTVATLLDALARRSGGDPKQSVQLVVG